MAGFATAKVLVDDGRIVRPGDKLIVRLQPEPGLDDAKAHDIKRQIEEFLPGVETLILVAADLHVYREVSGG